MEDGAPGLVVAAPGTPKPAEPADNPVEAAAKSALQERLAEMNRAEQHNKAEYEKRAAAQQRLAEEKPLSNEEIITKSDLPPLAKDWLRKFPQFMTDAAANAALVKAHAIAEYLNEGELYSQGYFDHLERVLGLKPRMNGNGHAAPAPAPRPTPQRSVANAPPPSAPVSREAPSMSTGRPLSESKQVTLTHEEKEFALSLQRPGQSQKEALDEYAANKLRMMREKMAGLHNG